MSVGIHSVERVPKATGFQLFWAAMWARAYPRIVGSLREKSWMIFETIFPILGVTGYVYYYEALGASDDYRGFVVLGGTMTAFWLNVLWNMGSQFYWDKDQGNLELYVLAPAPLMAILLGMAVGGVIFAGVRGVSVMILSSLLFQVSYSIASLPMLILIFLTTMAALYGMGMLFASVFLASGREAWHISNLLQEPIYLASGFYFPVRELGRVIASLASVIPLTLGLDAMRQLLFPSSPMLGFLSVPVELGILTALSVIFIGAAYFALSRLEEIGRREGRLIERRR